MTRKTQVEAMREARKRLRESVLFAVERISAQRDAQARRAALDAVREQRDGERRASR